MNCWEIILINSLEYHCMMSYRQKDQYTCGCKGPVWIKWRKDTSWYLCHFKKPMPWNLVPFLYIWDLSFSLTPCAMTIHVDGIDMMYVIYSFKLCKIPTAPMLHNLLYFFWSSDTYSKNRSRNTTLRGVLMSRYLPL